MKHSDGKKHHTVFIANRDFFVLSTRVIFALYIGTIFSTLTCSFVKMFDVVNLKDPLHLVVHRRVLIIPIEHPLPRPVS